MTKRCFWCSEDPEYIAYHDTEWGIPVRDDRHPVSYTHLTLPTIYSV